MEPEYQTVSQMYERLLSDDPSTRRHWISACRDRRSSAAAEPVRAGK